jgi:hypothetical protein
MTRSKLDSVSTLEEGSAELAPLLGRRAQAGAVGHLEKAQVSGALEAERRGPGNGGRIWLLEFQSALFS